MRQETVAALSTLARHFGSRQRTAIITHADVTTAAFWTCTTMCT